MRRLWAWPANFVRFLAISAVIGGALAVYSAHWLIAWFLPRRKARRAKLRGVLLRWGMTTLGATFIKLGQVLSTRPDLLPQETIDELKKLQDQCPPFPWKAARKSIEECIGTDVKEHFRVIDETPVAAASVAQVHRGELVTGEEVAIKVLRPQVRRQAKRDGGILLMFAHLLNLHPVHRQNDPVGHLRHFIDGIIGQTDLRTEDRNYTRFRELFDDAEGLRFPKVHHELSGERVLTMEFIHGVKIDTISMDTHADCAVTLRHAFFNMAFRHGFVHADLHPGNMLITEDKHLVIFDVGLVKELSPDTLDMFLDFNRCLTIGRGKDFINHFQRFHTYMEGADWEQIEKDSDEFIDKWRAKAMADLEMQDVIAELYELARKHGIRPEPELTLIMVGVVTVQGISKMLNPNEQSFLLVAEFIQKLMAEKEARDRGRF
jgi:ubiquinone biosynthesis protein